jgi:hypothetical protein
MVVNNTILEHFSGEEALKKLDRATKKVYAILMENQYCILTM